MPNLYVDSSDRLDKYSESKLENLLLEYLFLSTESGRTIIHGKIRRLFRQEEIWVGKTPSIKFPHSNWLRTTLKKIHANIATKGFREHTIENYGKDSKKAHEEWLSLDMKNFPEDFTIGHLKDSGKVDGIVGKTSIDTKKIFDKRYTLSKEYKNNIEEQIFDTSKVKVIINPKSANIQEATLSLTLDIEKEQIFEDNNIEYRVEDLDMEEDVVEAIIREEVSKPAWIDITSKMTTDPTDAEKKLIDLFWKKENIRIPDEIWNPYVNYKLLVAIIIPVPIAFKPQKSPPSVRIKRQSVYDAEKEIRPTKKDTEGKYNPPRENYLGFVKDRFDWLGDMADAMTENTEEE